MIRKRLLSVVALGLLSLTLIAQEPQSFNLSLAEAQTYALEHNRTIKSASYALQAAEQAKWQSIAKGLPQINASVDYSNYLGFQMEFAGMKLDMNPTSSFVAQASVGFSAAYVIGIQMSQIAKEMSQTNLQKSELDVKNQVKTLYFSILVTNTTLNLLNESMKNLQSLYALTEQSVKVGVAEQTDADQIAVQVSAMQNTINSSVRNVEVLFNMLRLQIGVNVNDTINLTQNLSDLMNADIALSLIKEEFDMQSNFDYQLVQNNEKLAKKQYNMSQWAYAPTVSAYYQYSYKILKPEMDMSPNNVFGAKLSVPIFSSGDRLAKVKETKFNYLDAQNSRESLEESLLVQEKQLKFNITNAYENYENQRKNIDVSQRVFKNISNKYEHGMSSSLEVTNASTNLISAQSNYVQAMYELISAQVELEKLLNK